MSETAAGIGALACIGSGAMATALLKSWIAAGLVKAEQVTATDIMPERRSAMQALGVRAVSENTVAAADANTILLAVKPQQVPDVLAEIGTVCRPGTLVISIAAGVPLQVLEAGLGTHTAVVRVMPNTPCLVGVSATGVSLGKNVNAMQSELVLQLFRSVGIAFTLPEKMLDAVTGLSGSGPAYVYLMIEALSDGGVAAGLPRDIATQMAAQTVLGAARMVMETKQHPAVLREMVTSPAGTTAAGLLALEESGLRAGMAHAVLNAAKRAHELGEAASAQTKNG